MRARVREPPPVSCSETGAVFAGPARPSRLVRARNVARVLERADRHLRRRNPWSQSELRDRGLVPRRCPWAPDPDIGVGQVPHDERSRRERSRIRCDHGDQQGSGDARAEWIRDPRSRCGERLRGTILPAKQWAPTRLNDDCDWCVEDWAGVAERRRRTAMTRNARRGSDRGEIVEGIPICVAPCG